MDDVYHIAVEIYARAIADRLKPEPGNDWDGADSKELAQKAITAASTFMQAAQNRGRFEFPNLPDTTIGTGPKRGSPD